MYQWKTGKSTVNLIFVPVFKPDTHKRHILKHCTNIVSTFTTHNKYEVSALNYSTNHHFLNVLVWLLIPSHGRDRMLDVFTTTCAISAYHH